MIIYWITFQSLFYWITYSYILSSCFYLKYLLFQSLFYWITYSYILLYWNHLECNCKFQSLFYWITYSYSSSDSYVSSLIKVSILILLDYLFLWYKKYGIRNYKVCFNPYFTGLPILIRSVEKTLYLLLLQNFFQTLKSSFFWFF